MDWSMPGFPALHYIPEFLVILLVPPVCSNRLFETPLLVWWTIEWLLGFPGGSVVKYPPASAGDAGDMGLIPGMERSPEGGNGNPLQYSCLGNPHGRRSLVSYTVHGVTKSQTRLKDWAQTIISLVQSLSPIWLWNPMDCRMPGLPVHHQLPEFTQTHVHWVSDAIQPSHPLSSTSSPALNLSQHQGLFKWGSSSHQVGKVLEFQLQHQSFQWIFRTDFL